MATHLEIRAVISLEILAAITGWEIAYRADWFWLGGI